MNSCCGLRVVAVARAGAGAGDGEESASKSGDEVGSVGGGGGGDDDDGGWDWKSRHPHCRCWFALCYVMWAVWAVLLLVAFYNTRMKLFCLSVAFIALYCCCSCSCCRLLLLLLLISAKSSYTRFPKICFVCVFVFRFGFVFNDLDIFCEQFNLSLCLKSALFLLPTASRNWSNEIDL